MLKYLLDTNICITLSKINHRKSERLFIAYYGQFGISSVTLMELIYGAEKSINPEKKLAVIEGFATRMEVLTYGFDTTVHTGQIHTELTRKGTPIGSYDTCWQAMPAHLD